MLTRPAMLNGFVVPTAPMSTVTRSRSAWRTPSFVEDVRVAHRDVDDGDVGVGNQLDHSLVDRTGARDLVSANDLKRHPPVGDHVHRRLDDAVVHLAVEVDAIPSRRVRSDRERHDCKTRAHVLTFQGRRLPALRGSGRSSCLHGRSPLLKNHWRPMMVFASVKRPSASSRRTASLGIGTTRMSSCSAATPPPAETWPAPVVSTK